LTTLQQVLAYKLQTITKKVWSRSRDLFLNSGSRSHLRNGWS